MLHEVQLTVGAEGTGGLPRCRAEVVTLLNTGQIHEIRGRVLHALAGVDDARVGAVLGLGLLHRDAREVAVEGAPQLGAGQVAVAVAGRPELQRLDDEVAGLGHVAVGRVHELNVSNAVRTGVACAEHDTCRDVGRRAGRSCRGRDGRADLHARGRRRGRLGGVRVAGTRAGCKSPGGRKADHYGGGSPAGEHVLTLLKL